VEDPRLGEGHALALLEQQVLGAKRAQDRLGAGSGFALVTKTLREVKQRRPWGRPAVGVSNHHALRAIERREKYRLLESARHAKQRALVGGVLRDIATEDRDRSFVGRDVPAARIQERRLAGPVGSDQGSDLACYNFDTRAFERPHTTEPL